MATTSVEIVNQALILLGSEPITALSDNTKSARAANAVYDALRREVILAHPWNFAVARKALSATANTPEFDYSYEFGMGADVLRILDTDLGNGVEWEVGINPTSGVKVLMCNSNSVSIKYVKDIEDVTLFPATFQQALAARIATHLCYALVQSAQLQSNLYNLYKDLVAQARSFDAQESSDQEIGADSWTDVRL